MENGWHPAGQRDWARRARLDHIPTPLPTTYPEGGGAQGDYYAFTWGSVALDHLEVSFCKTGGGKIHAIRIPRMP